MENEKIEEIKESPKLESPIIENNPEQERLDTINSFLDKVV